MRSTTPPISEVALQPPRVTGTCPGVGPSTLSTAAGGTKLVLLQATR